MMAIEMVSRRKWEKEMTAQMQRMNGDYDRLVRETARNRNDLVMLKKSLADAGAAARGLGRMQATEGLAVEQRMIKSLAEQLSRLGGDDGKEDAPLDIGALEQSLLQASPGAIVKNLTDEQVLTLVRAAVKQ